jgi:bifunctional non-homologous end joining protein LigD
MSTGLCSRNSSESREFPAEFGKQIGAALPNVAVIDGEICSLGRRGKLQFKNLLFRRGNPPCFFAFDLLNHDGKDLRTERLMDRKQELRRLLASRIIVANAQRHVACHINEVLGF